MADRRFFASSGPLTLGEIAERSGARIAAGDAARSFTDVAPLETAGPDDVSFLDNRKYIDAFAVSRAGAAFILPELAERAPAGMALLVTAQPYKAYARAAASFYPEPPVPSGIAASAVVDPGAEIGEGTTIGPHVVIGERAVIGRRCRIGAGTVIGPGVVIGDDARIASQVTLTHCLLGARVSIFPGVRIGQDGFGFAPDPAGHVKVPQLGRVVIGDDVEIGANCTIDRGAGPDTVIGAGTKIDNLVHIAHNVTVGQGCLLAGQVGISGSSKLAEFVMAGGQVGVAGHLRIGRGAKLAAKSGVMRDVPDGMTVSGFPAVPFTEYWRQVAAVKRLVKRRGE